MNASIRLILGSLFCVMLTTLSIQAQGFRGFGDGGRPDPETMFKMFSKGKDTIVRSELDGFAQRMFDRMAEKAGVTNGVLTKDQFIKASEEMRKERESGGGSMRMMGGSGGPSSFSPPTGSPSPIPVPPSSNDRDRNRGGDDRVDRTAENFFNSRDRNKDGLLTFDEMTDQLQAERDKYDSNKDGFIDLNEYKVYMKDRFAQDSQNRDQSRPSSDNRTPTPGAPPVIIQETAPTTEPERKRPTMMRAGKLPKELPSWFERYDTDKDGQVAMYEWNKESGKSLTEFQEYDMNLDGFITPEECLKVTKFSAEEKAKYLATRKDAVDSEESIAAANTRPSLGNVSYDQNRYGSSNSSRMKDEKDKGNKDEKRMDKRSMFPNFGGGSHVIAMAIRRQNG